MTEKIRGAEAEVEIEDETVIKRRNRKKYRHPELDSRLVKERTSTEEELLARAKRYGVNVPDVEEKKDRTLVLERLHGEPLKEVAEKKEVFEQLGENVAYLHSAGIIHGDLTTSNAILSDDSVFLIDFGLAFRSERDEDRAVDIHLLKQMLETSHPEIAETAWSNFLEGYSEIEDSEDVLEQLEEVEKRGRYK